MAVRRRGARRRAVALLAGALLAACGGDAGQPAADGPATRESTDDPTAVVVPDTLAADSAPPGREPASTDDDPALPPMPGEGEPREFRLLLVNPHDHAARVFASAGSDRVALDTVPARDSTLVDVRVRADRILLEAEDEQGAGIGSIELDLGTGGTNRWEIGPPPGPRVASAGAPRAEPGIRRAESASTKALTPRL